MFSRLIVLGALALTACKDRTPVRVYIDNGRDVTATIRVDGAPMAEVAPHDIGEMTVTPEPHTITAVAPDGTNIDEATMAAPREGEPHRPWAFNLGGTSEYVMRIVYYCTAQNSYLCNTPLRPLPFRPKAHFFEMPYTFMTALPETRMTTEQSAQAQSIEHVPVHWNHPCCRRLYKKTSQ